MMTPPTHQRPNADAGEGRAGRRASRPAALSRPIDRRIVNKVLIMGGIALIMLVFVVVDVAQGTLGLGWAVGGLLAGVAVGVVASRSQRIQWDEQTDHVVARLDWIGAVILAGYIASTLARDWVLGHWAQGPALAALGLSVTAGALAGQALGTRYGVRAVLRTVGVGAVADPDAAPAAPGVADQPGPGGDGR